MTTDRGFLTKPDVMVKGFLLAGLLSGVFSAVGLYARAERLKGAATVAVSMTFGLPLLLVFNAIMLTSAGSTLDTTFASTAKLVAIDWPDRRSEPKAYARSGARRC